MKCIEIMFYIIFCWIKPKNITIFCEWLFKFYKIITHEMTMNYSEEYGMKQQKLGRYLSYQSLDVETWVLGLWSLVPHCWTQILTRLETCRTSTLTVERFVYKQPIYYISNSQKTHNLKVCIYEMNDVGQ